MLPKKNRISRKDFPSHKMQGFRVFSPLFSAVFYKENKLVVESRASIVVSKKTAKTAVVRNKLRRRFYNLLAPHFKSVLAPFTVVIYPKVEAQKVESLILNGEIKKALRQAKVI